MDGGSSRNACVRAQRNERQHRRASGNLYLRGYVSLCVVALSIIAGCAEIGAGPDVPTAIEFSPFPSPSVVVGDTLRNVAGVVTPISAVVRNVSGDVIPDANVRYLYADFARDGALRVDSISGIVVAVKTTTDDMRLAARAGSSLQILKKIIVTIRPDSISRAGIAALDTFRTILPDTIPKANTSPELTVVVQHLESSVTSNVNAWPVRFELLQPANPTNDTTLAAFLVDDAGRPSTLDTTSSSGQAGRKVRFRAAQFPAAGVTESVIVRVTSSYKGAPLKGSPYTIVLYVARGTVATVTGSASAK